MLTNQIQSAISTMFCKGNNISTILIDGQWGIGKTYATLNTLKEIKNCKYAYSSFFGKASIEELNTELYHQLNKADKVLHTISSIVSLIGASVSFAGVGINLNGTTFESNHKIKKRKKNTIVVVLDDLERVDDKITQNDLLGYINQLNLQGVKVIALSNLNKDLEKRLGGFKEKVFDRIYQITETPLEIAQSLVNENAQIDSKCLNLVSNNLRMFIKANSLYNQINAYLQSQSNDSDKTIPFRYCLYVVEESLNRTLSTIYRETLGKWTDVPHPYNDSLKVPAIVSYEDSEYGNNIENSLLISAIFNVFEQNDFSLIDEIFFCSHETSILLSEIFYLSDENKIATIKQQYDYILNKANSTELNLVWQAIRNWHQYAFYMDLSFIDKEKLFERLYTLGTRHADPMLAEGDNYIAFLKEYNDYYDKKDIAQLDKVLRTTPVYTKEFYSLLSEITLNYISYSLDKKEQIKLVLRENSFYIKNLGDDINELIWRTIHSIGYLIKERIPELRQEVYEYLEKTRKEQPTNKTLNRRIDTLEKQYLVQ